MRNLLKKFGFGQKRCAHCGEPYFDDDCADAPVEALCPACLTAITPGNFYMKCRGCGLPLTNPVLSGKNGLCVYCENEPPSWHGVAYYGPYQGPLRDLILRLKFDGELYLAPVLATFLLNSSFCLSKPHAIIPIPQYPARLRKRGYNQAHEIGRELARLSGLPFLPHLLRRTGSGVAQEGLTRQQRRQNLAGAFQGQKEAKGLDIWLIDDVFTTGATTRVATEALLNAGATSVQLLFVARTSYF